MRYPFVHEIFQQLAEENPQLPAVVSPSTSLTYGYLDAWANNVANRLLASGVGRGSLIYIAAKHPAAVIASILAVLKVNGVFVPIDLHQPLARLEQLSAQAPAVLVLTELEHVDRVSAIFGAHAGIIPVNAGMAGRWGKPLLPNYTNGKLENVIKAPSSTPDPDDLSYIYFTSGSSGAPKAIAGRLASIDHFVRWEIEQFGVQKGTAVSQLTSPVFDAFLRDAFVPLCVGGVLHLLEDPDTKLDPRRLVEWLEQSGVEIIHIVPSLFRLILGETLRPDMFTSLRYIALAGEVVLPSDVRRWMDVFGDRVQLVNMYGPTETTMIKLFHLIKRSDIELSTIPIGQPIADTEVLVLNEAGQPAAVGEIYIRTPYRALGYYRNSEMTDQVFVPNPLTNDATDVVYKTGDFGRVLDDGNVEFLGRKDQQVKIRGVRIELEGIENAIFETGLVNEAAVTCITDSVGNAYLAAYFVSAGESDPTDALRTALALTLPEYQVPSVFLRLDALPRTQTLKVDRRALPHPEVVRAGARTLIEPRTESEKQIAALFAEVLALDKVGVNEDFFLLGGHSLLAMKLLSRLSAHFELELPLALLFEHPTVEEMTANIEERRKLGSATPAYFKRSEPPADSDRASETLVAQMSDSEVESLLTDILSINE